MYSSPAALPLISSPPTWDILPWILLHTKHRLVKCFTKLWWSFSGSDIIGAVINPTMVWFCISFHSHVTSQLLWELDSRGLWCSFGCHLLLQSCVYYRATTSIYILWSFIIFPWNLMIDVFHSVGIACIDAKLCQHSVAGPFPQTVYLVRSVHKPSSWQPGLYWSKVRRASSAGNRWFRPPFCGQGSDHVLYASPDREKYT